MGWLILYFACMCLGCARHFSKRPERDEYFVCGRQAGVFTAAMSILASCIGGTATIGMIGLAAKDGWPAIWWLGAGVAGLLLLGTGVAAKIRASGCLTLPELIETCLGPGCRFVSALIVVASSIPIVAAQFSAAGLLLAYLTGLDANVCIVAGALSVALYTWAGGQKAVMQSDIWQFLILALALLLAFLLFAGRPVGRAALAATPVELFNNGMPPGRALYFLLVFGGSFLIGPMLSGRLLSVRTPGAADRAALWAAAGLGLIAILVTATGVALSGLGPEALTQDQVLLAAMRADFPSWANIAVIFGLISAVVSSSDSCIFSAASIWTNDIRKRPDVPRTRRAVMAVSLGSLALVFCGKDILGLLLAASDIYSCGVVFPTLIGLLAGIRGGGRLFYAAMIGGGACGAIAAICASQTWSFAGLGLSALLSLWGALLARKKTAPGRT